MAEDPNFLVLEELSGRLYHGEGLTLEFKSAQGGLPDNLWETISAFANTNGGIVILGIDPRPPYNILGVKNPQKRLQEFLNEVRNPKKISHPICGAEDASVVRVDDTDVIIIRVPAAGRRQRPVFIGANPYTGTFIRLAEGDYRCRKHEVDQMIRDAAEASLDSTVLDHFSLSDLDPDAVARYRRRFQTAHPDSPWIGYEDAQFLASINAYARDRERNAEGITVAGLLALGKQDAIWAFRSHHVIDFQVEADDPERERWGDRLVWEGNLLGAFEEILPRLWRDLPQPFLLEGGARVEQTPVHIALREALINLLTHADYVEQSRSLIRRSKTRCLFQNPGRSLVPYNDLFDGHHSELRNPLLVRIFRLVGIGEEAGSGVAAILKAWRDLGYRPPRISEGGERCEFSLELPFQLFYLDEDREWLHAVGQPLSQAEQFALLYAKHEGYVDNESLRAMTAGLHPADATKCLTGLRERQLLRQVGTGRGSRYELGLAIPTIAVQRLDINTTQTALPIEPGRSNTGYKDTSIGYKDTSIGYKEGGSGSEAEEQLSAIAAPAREHHRIKPAQLDAILVALCQVRALSLQELAALTARNEGYIRKRLNVLVTNGQLRFLHHRQPRHPNQKYLAVAKSQSPQ